MFEEPDALVEAAWGLFMSVVFVERRPKLVICCVAVDEVGCVAGCEWKKLVVNIGEVSWLANCWC